MRGHAEHSKGEEGGGGSCVDFDQSTVLLTGDSCSFHMMQIHNLLQCFTHSETRLNKPKLRKHAQTLI